MRTRRRGVAIGRCRGAFVTGGISTRWLTGVNIASGGTVTKRFPRNSLHSVSSLGLGACLLALVLRGGPAHPSQFTVNILRCCKSPTYHRSRRPKRWPELNAYDQVGRVQRFDVRPSANKCRGKRTPERVALTLPQLGHGLAIFDPIIRRGQLAEVCGHHSATGRHRVDREVAVVGDLEWR
jgi:hypothetical protein